MFQFISSIYVLIYGYFYPAPPPSPSVPRQPTLDEVECQLAPFLSPCLVGLEPPYGYPLPDKRMAGGVFSYGIVGVLDEGVGYHARKRVLWGWRWKPNPGKCLLSTDDLDPYEM